MVITSEARKPLVMVLKKQRLNPNAAKIYELLHSSLTFMSFYADMAKLGAIFRGHKICFLLLLRRNGALFMFEQY